MLGESWNEISESFVEAHERYRALGDSERADDIRKSIVFLANETCREWGMRAAEELGLEYECDPQFRSHIISHISDELYADEDGELFDAITVRLLCLLVDERDPRDIMPAWWTTERLDDDKSAPHPLLSYAQVLDVARRYIAPGIDAGSDSENAYHEGSELST